MERYWILTCEHASNAVPKPFRGLFADSKKILETHRGYDIGARHYAESFARALSCPLICGHTTRLLVDLNRSSDNPHLFSSFTNGLEATTRRKIISRYYTPFRAKVLHLVEQKVASGVQVMHISCHSFTPVLNGKVRAMDFGILYDPKRRAEKDFAEAIKERLREETSMRVRFNAPYRGVSDGHVTALRRLFSEDRYVGIEFEVNQALYMPIKSRLWQDAWVPCLIEILHGVFHS